MCKCVTTLQNVSVKTCFVLISVRADAGPASAPDSFYFLAVKAIIIVEQSIVNSILRAKIKSEIGQSAFNVKTMLLM